MSLTDGGVPVYMWHNANDPYPLPGEYEYRAFIEKGVERWALFGFVVLDFDGPDLSVRYINERGEEHQRDELAAALAAPRRAGDGPT